MDQTHQDIAAQLDRVVNQLLALEKKTVLRHGKLRLHPSEIHLMLVVDEDSSRNATAMAQRLGVSKGAVSQTLTRLENKGVIVKVKDAGAKNELWARFTPLGREAIGLFKKQRSTLQAAHVAYLAGLPDGDRKAIQGFLTHLERFLAALG